MQINNNFISTIEKHMYDKTIYVHNTDVFVDNELNKKMVLSELREEKKCNIQSVNHVVLKNKYGLDITGDYIITTSKSDIKKDNYIKYNNDTYSIKELLEYNSHLKIIIEKVKL